MTLTSQEAAAVNLKPTKRLKRKRGAGRIVALILLVAMVSGLAGWSLGKIFSPPPAATGEKTVSTFTVKQGRIGKSITLNAAATWGSEASGINRAVGVVTSMASIDEPVKSGDAVYTVGLAPVALVAGSTPAFREITTGTDGSDVTQLAVMLAERGYGVDPETSKVDWFFAQAIKAWQKSIGAEANGTVANGALIFVPGLPAKIQFEPETITVGATLAGGEKVLTVASAIPEFSIEVPNEQAQSILTGTSVVVKNNDTKWTGEVAGIKDSANSTNKLLVLGSTTDTPICGQECGGLTATKDALFPTEITLVPRQEGLVVPSSAIRTNASGSTSVLLQSGAEVPVETVATSGGMTIVSGVDAGTVIQLWAPAPPKS